MFCRTATLALAASTASAQRLDAPLAATNDQPEQRMRVAGNLPLLDKDQQLRRFHFWQNQDWAWYSENIPFFESSDPVLDQIYYYRWEVVTRHLRYTTPAYGYVCTEFLPIHNEDWAGRYGAISGAADLQMDELRWMRNTSPAHDFLRYFLTVPGARPRAYGFAPTWVGYRLALANGSAHALSDLLPACVENYRGWERGVVAYPEDNGFDTGRGLFWNTGRDMGSEFNLASAQLSETLRGISGYKIRGGAGYRPDINAVLFAEAQAIAKLALSLGENAIAKEFAAKAASLKHNVQTQLWDPQREFFMHRWRYDEYADGDTPGHKSIRAGSLIWETNARTTGIGFQPAQEGKDKGREIFCYHLWRYGLPDDNEDSNSATGYARAWRFLNAPDGFAGAFGPATGEKRDPWFSVIYGECRHNGQSWPYHTSRVLAGGLNLLRDYTHHRFFSRQDWRTLFQQYILLHRNANEPFIAESHDPDRPQWTELRPAGFHYLHSSFLDLVITGVVGLHPRADDVLEVDPLAPPEWDYFAIDELPYRGRLLSILWDRTGERYGRGRGLHVFANGLRLASANALERITATLPPRPQAPPVAVREYNFAVNADDQPFPKALASFACQDEPPEHAINGSCWFDLVPPNRWTSRGSPSPEHWFEIQFGQRRLLHRIELFFYEDDLGVAAPRALRVEVECEGRWTQVATLTAYANALRARCGTRISFAAIQAERIRVLITAQESRGCGLSQFAAWGTATSV